MSHRIRLAKLEESILGTPKDAGLVTVDQWKWVASQTMDLPWKQNIEETSRLYKELGIRKDVIDSTVARMCKVGRNQGWITEEDVNNLKL